MNFILRRYTKKIINGVIIVILHKINVMRKISEFTYKDTLIHFIKKYTSQMIL